MKGLWKKGGNHEVHEEHEGRSAHVLTVRSMEAMEMLGLSAEIDLVGRDVVDASVKVHRAMEPGLLESVYEECMAYELSVNRGVKVERQVELPILYDGVKLRNQLRLDMVVEGCVILELKAVERILPLHQAQLITYLKLTGLRLGFLLNFNVPLMKNGIKRMVR